MAHICPAWLGYFLLNPLRRLLENPEKLLSGIIGEGMTVLEPGCGMGYFTLPIARMVGPAGKVVAVDIQPKMLSGLSRRAQKQGLMDRIEVRLATETSLCLEDLAGKVDTALALHMLHEVPRQASFLKEIWNALKSDGRFLVVEPRFHVSKKDMENAIALAETIGFKPLGPAGWGARRGALLAKHDKSRAALT